MVNSSIGILVEEKLRRSITAITINAKQKGLITTEEIPVSQKNGYVGYKRRLSKLSVESFEALPLYNAVLIHVGCYILMFLARLNHILFTPNKVFIEKLREGYVPLYDGFELSFIYYIYRRIRDCWNTPICSAPGTEVVLKDRVTKDFGWTFEFTGTKTKCINLASFNYLGLSGEIDLFHEINSIKKHGLTTCSSRTELGTTGLHRELEKVTANFLGVEDAISFGMGFATNACSIPSLAEEGCLVCSDERNHVSLILGLKLSQAVVKVFKHNDMKDLEQILSESIINGQPKTGRPWRKIFIVVEGIYSMEGSIVHLPELIRLKKKYKAYLYVDEAHSMGAIGRKGRGVADYFGCDPQDIDIHMGSYAKSIGAIGGYIAGKKELIDYIRVNSSAAYYAPSMSPAICQVIISSIKLIMGEDGTQEGQRRLRQLKHNTRYFRKNLNQMGLIVYGNDYSHIVPILVPGGSRMSELVRQMIKKNIAVVGVGFPATHLLTQRLRICISASHTKQQLDSALKVIEDYSNELSIKCSSKQRTSRAIVYGEDSDDESSGNNYIKKSLKSN